MAEEFVLLESAPTGAIVRHELPERYARATPNPLPLVPDMGSGRHLWGWGLAAILALGVMNPMGAALWFASRDARSAPPGEPAPAPPPPPPTPNDEPPPRPFSDPVRPEPAVVADGRYPDLHSEWRSYRIPALGGETIKVEVRSAADGRDLHLELLDASGAQVGQHDWSDGGASVTWRVERDEVLSLNVANPRQLRHDLIVSRVAEGLGPGVALGLTASVAGSSYPFQPFHGGHGLLVTVRFPHAAGDVDARLLDESGLVCAESAGVVDLERLFVRDARSCDQLVLYRADNVVDVEVERVVWLDAGYGQPIDAPSAGCVFVRAGQELQVTATFSHAQGDVELELIAGGQLVATSVTATDREEGCWTAPADTDVVIRLFHAGTPVATTSDVVLDVELR